MPNLTPIETLYDASEGGELPLTPNLARLYGKLRFPAGLHSPYVISNFVSTMDGVVALGLSGETAEQGISGNNRHDKAVMGILRAVADAVVVGSKNLAASAQHIWTAEEIFPKLSEDYQELRRTMGKEETPLNVIVTAHPKIDPSLPIFKSGKVNVLIVTTTTGATSIPKEKLPAWVSVDEAGSGEKLGAREIVNAVLRARPKSKIILVEGGPHLLGTFLGDNALDELFLTIAPQLAGRDHSPERLGLVEGMLLAPDNPVWSKLSSIKRAENFLFLRYRIGT